MGIKLTLGQVRDQGDVRLLFYCCGNRATNPHCRRSAEMDLAAAIARWGPGVRLDDLPMFCRACESRDIDVRADNPENSRMGATGPADPWALR